MGMRSEGVVTPECGRCGGRLRLFESVRLLLWAWVCDNWEDVGCRMSFEALALVDDERFFVENWEDWGKSRRPRPGGRRRP